MNQDKDTILYIGGFELPDKNAAAQRVIANGKLFHKMGYKVVYDGIAKEEKDIRGIDASKQFFGFDAYAQKYPQGFKEWVGYTLEIDRYIKLIKKYPKTKVAICYNLPAGSLWKLLLYGRRNNIKIISDCTEWYQRPKRGNILRNYIKGVDIFLRMKVIQPKLDGIIAISDFLFQFYNDKKVPTVKIPPLVDLTDDKWAKIDHDQNTMLHFLYAGSPFSLSNKANVKDRLDLIIQALTKLKRKGFQFVFEIIGITKENIISFFPNLKNDIDYLDKNILFYGRISHEKTIHQLKQSDFSIFIRDENLVTKAGFPTKFVESLSCGIPVITSKSSNLSDYLQEGINGLWVEMKDLQAIESSIEKAFLFSKKEVEDLKNNCISSRLFDFNNFENDMKLFFESLEIQHN